MLVESCKAQLEAIQSSKQSDFERDFERDSAGHAKALSNPTTLARAAAPSANPGAAFASAAEHENACSTVISNAKWLRGKPEQRVRAASACGAWPSKRQIRIAACGYLCSTVLSLSLCLSLSIYLSLSLCRSFWYVVSVSLVVASLERFGRSCSSRSSCLFRPSGARLGCSLCFALVPLVRSIYLLCCRASLFARLGQRPVSPTLEVSSLRLSVLLS